MNEEAAGGGERREVRALTCVGVEAELMHVVLRLALRVSCLRSRCIELLPALVALTHRAVSFVDNARALSAQLIQLLI